MCVLVDTFINEAFWPAENNFWMDIPLQGASPALGTSHWYHPSCGCHQDLGYDFLKNLFRSQIYRIHIQSSYINLGPEYRQGREMRRILFALSDLILLIWFLFSGFVLRVRDGGDFVRSMMSRRRLGRWGAGDIVALGILEIYYLVWLDVMIGVMLQHW
jgi:hypothetical protein